MAPFFFVTAFASALCLDFFSLFFCDSETNRRVGAKIGHAYFHAPSRIGGIGGREFKPSCLWRKIARCRLTFVVHSYFRNKNYILYFRKWTKAI